MPGSQNPKSHVQRHDQDGGNKQSTDVKNEILDYVKNIERMKKFDPDKIVEFGEKMGKVFSKSVTTSQIRNFYSDMVEISEEAKKEQEEFPYAKVKMLLPKMAYAAGRHTKLKDIYEILAASINKIEPDEFGKEDFQRFFDLFQSFLAYHKFYGGKE